MIHNWVGMATIGLMTVSEFLKLKDPPGAWLELHHGARVEMTRPKHKHAVIQSALFLLLRRLAPQGKAQIEFAFRPRPEYELWCADVAWTTRQRYREIDPDGYLAGSPELAVEVLSPSNTAAEILEKETICLETGAREFWIVNPERRTVKVNPIDRPSRTYSMGEAIPLFCGEGESLPMNEIFEDPE